MKPRREYADVISVAGVGKSMDQSPHQAVEALIASFGSRRAQAFQAGIERAIPLLDKPVRVEDHGGSRGNKPRGFCAGGLVYGV